MRFCNLFLIERYGRLTHHSTAYANDIPHAESICDECHLRDEHGRHYLLTVLDFKQEKVVHTYTSQDAYKGGKRHANTLRNMPGR